MTGTGIGSGAAARRGASWSPPMHPGSWRRRVAALLAATVMVPTMAAIPAGAATTYDPMADPHSMNAVTEITGAEAWWDAGYTGEGIDVAIIDTGVSPVAGLATPGKVVHGPDLSLESQAPGLQHLDTNGHGTFMAGLIAGKDSTLTTPYADAPATAYRGMAPDARIVSLKVATADGGTDVSQVIAAINWVVEHKNDNGMNIRVLSLSYGTNSTQSADIDPLSYAVEQAWKNGIVVVAAAGNSGYQRGNNAPGLASPAYNPWVIAVGGYDTMGTMAPNDDVMGDYSASSAGCGSECKNPDLVAVGSHLQGLRVPNGFIDQRHPEGRLGARYFRGSGTSQAAAVTAGTVALILEKYPNLTPDQVKRFMTDNGKKVPGADSQAQGKGEISLVTLAKKTPSSYVQKLNHSNGTGSLEAARGSDHLTINGVKLTGERDIFGRPFDAVVMATLAASGNSWSGGTWNGNSWSGNSWSGNSWSGNSWSGNSWSGNSWSGNSWSGNSWSGNSWSGNSWSGNSWSGTSWSGNAWATGHWG